MSLATPLHRVDIEEWLDAWSDCDDAYELVAGVPTMAPTESGTNINAASLLLRRLDREIGRHFDLLPNYGVRLRVTTDSDTVRQPDLVVLSRGVDISRSYVEAADVTLVVEVVSPSSIERDWVTKRAEYAAAGIPAYLVIDTRPLDDDQPPLLALFELSAGGETDYADPAGDGTAVTLRIGARTITIDATDLVRGVRGE